MTNKVFDLCANELMISEGGYVNDPKDPGGETKYGVSKRAYPNEDIKNMTEARAKQIFKRDFWDKCKCGELPDCVSIIVSDCAYNSGCSRAIKLLQKTVKTTEDGIIGKMTLSAVSKMDKQKLLWEYRENRLNFLKSLSTWKNYGKGWTDRCNKIHDLASKYI